MICSASDFNSSGLSGAVSSAISSPFTRMVAGRPTLSNRSDAVRWTMCVMACLKLNVGPVAWGASAMRIHPEEGLSERSEEHTSELQSRLHLVCRLLLEKKKKK